MAKESYRVRLDPETIKHLKEHASELNLKPAVLARFYIQKGLEEKKVVIVKVRQGKVTCPIINYDVEERGE